MSLIFSIIFSAIYILLISFFVFASRTNYKNNVKSNFSYKRNFTYEITDFDSKMSIPLRMLYFILAILSIVPFLYYVFAQVAQPSFVLNKYNSLDKYVIASTLLMLVTTFSQCGLFTLKIKAVKHYLLMYVVRSLSLFISILVLVVGLGCSYGELSNFSKENNVAIGIFLIIFSILCLVILAFYCNPKLYKWYVLEKRENGQYEFPNTVYLALNEWILELIQIIFVVCFAFLIYVRMK